MNPQSTIAYFITPHGFGHAARAIAVMDALQTQNPALRCEIFTTVPAWFFRQTLRQPFGYHELLTDIGLVQTTALIEDAAATVERLAHFAPFPVAPRAEPLGLSRSAEPSSRASRLSSTKSQAEGRSRRSLGTKPRDEASLSRLADQLHDLGCTLVLCDISPLGLSVARAAGLPSILIENFTWDWIYAGYAAAEPRLLPYIDLFAQLFAQADHHIQIQPVCQPCAADLTVPPVSREPRTPAATIRQQLGVSPEAAVVIITMGGVAWDYTFLHRLHELRPIQFIIPGVGETMVRNENILLLPTQSPFYHPDLVNAADALIGKLGYSTLAETYHAGIPYGYVTRPHFRESETFATFADRSMPGFAIDGAAFAEGAWIPRIPDLLSLPRQHSQRPNGAGPVAAFISQLL